MPSTWTTLWSGATTGRSYRWREERTCRKGGSSKKRSNALVRACVCVFVNPGQQNSEQKKHANRLCFTRTMQGTVKVERFLHCQLLIQCYFLGCVSYSRTRHLGRAYCINTQAPRQHTSRSHRPDLQSRRSRNFTQGHHHTGVWLQTAKHHLHSSHSLLHSQNRASRSATFSRVVLPHPLGPSSP